MTEFTHHSIKSPDVNAIAQIAQAALTPISINLSADNLLFIPASGGKPSEVIDLEKIRQPLQPRRKSGTVTVLSVDAFNLFVQQNKDAGNIVVYVDGNVEHLAIIAVLNDNGVKGPGHRDFRCSIAFRETVEWKKWKAIDGKMLEQAAFAEFIEENISDIHSPTGAQMLEIATYLQATRSVDFKSALNLSSGNVQFQNIESLDAKVGAGQVDIPNEFILGIAPIYGSKPFKVPARFRYRLVEGKLRLGFKLLRLEDVMSQIFDEAIKEVVTGDDIVMIWGTP